MRNRESSWFDVYGARVSALGEVLDPGGIPICTNVSTAYYPAVAFDGANYLVVWADDRDQTEGNPRLEIYGARISPGGAVLDPNGIQITHGEVATQPTLAFNGTEYLVCAYTWEHNGARGTTLLGVRVTPEGEGGKPAQTLYRVKRRFKTHTLVELEPLTGRAPTRGDGRKRQPLESAVL